MWPKQLPVLTPEQTRIREDFVKFWHETLPRSSYSLVETFNQRYPLRNWRRKDARILEIGAGLGEHIAYERMHNANYYALELRKDMAQQITKRFPEVTTIIGDIQQPLDFAPQYFDRVIAIHVLEHLPDLPAALNEVYRLLRPDGRFDVVIPCEGGTTYTLARNISARRLFEKRYSMSYTWFVQSEHVNTPDEILTELKQRFIVNHSCYFPLLVPSIALNLVIGLRLSPRT